MPWATLILLLAFHTRFAHALNLPFSQTSVNNRRSFLQKVTVASCSSTIPLFVPKQAFATSTTPLITQTVKVNPIAHTFVLSTTANKPPSIKPLRENDSTRFLTNARVVHVFYDGEEEKSQKTFGEILDLTVKRKKGEGAGVTPGAVHYLSGDGGGVYSNIDGLSVLKGSTSSQSLKTVLEKLPSDDVVIVSPKKSIGTVGNGKIVEETGTVCGLDVGGQRGGGVISLLLNGPKDPEPIIVVDGDYSTSTIVWYDAL
jgi:hypothetical protein